MNTSADQPVLLTFGHGTLDRAALAELLESASVSQVVDVRRYPGSRTNPAAKSPALEELAADLGIGYRWDERLGGRRNLNADELADNPYTWWRVRQFRAYAAWTRSADFRAGVQDLVGQLTAPPEPADGGHTPGHTAVMCSEAVWWRCHRRIIADVVLGEHQIPVRHLMHDGRLTPHELSDGARLDEDGHLVWDGP